MARTLTIGGVVTAAVVGAAAPAGAAPGDTVTTTVQQAIADLPVEPEGNDGYARSKFTHWIDQDRDGCDTRAEVLLEEAVEAPTVTGRCSIEGGQWYSYYDGQVVRDASGLDIDHMVPLKEAWGSGARYWSAEERKAYANDLDQSSSLVAVTAQQNRQKADKDPADWKPALAGAHCHYLRDWLRTKARWGLSADQREVTELRAMARGCDDSEITYTLAR